MQASLTCLGQCASEHGCGDAVELGVQLDSGHELGGTCHLEVHIAQCVFRAEDVGQGCVAGLAVNLVRDQAHCDTCNGCAQRHTGVQQGQGRCADRTHGGRAVGAQSLRDLTDCVGELFAGGQHRGDCTLCECTVADFAALGRTHAAGLTGGVRREVVVVDVALGLDRVQGVQLLLHLEHVQGGDTHDLGFAALEESGTVNAGQDFNLSGELADVGQAAAVDTDLLGEDALANHVLGQGSECYGDLVGALFEFLTFAGESFHELFLQLSCRCFAFLLASDGVHLCQAVCCECLNCCVDVLTVAAEEGQFQGGLACASHQVSLRLAQCCDEGLSCFQALCDNLFGGGSLAVFLDELPGVVGCFCLNHHDGDVFGTVSLGDDTTCNSHVEHSVFQLGVLGEADPLAVDQCHAHATDGAVERRTGQGGRCGRSVDCEGVVDFVRLVGQDGHNDLNLVADALGEGGAQRAVNQACSQDCLGAGAAFAAEVRCGNLAACVHALFHVHGQREEVEALTGRLADCGCGEQGGLVIDGDEDGASSLLCEAAGFKAHVALTVNAVVDFDFSKLDFGTFHGSFFLLGRPYGARVGLR